MYNIEKYATDLKAAVAAYNAEMLERSEHGLDRLPFEDWVDEDTDKTARLVTEAKEREAKIAAALADEKESIRRGMAELKEFYKANGFEEADELTTEIYRVAPKYDLYMKHISACNCFHSGMWEVYCGDFDEVWDYYTYCKNNGYNFTWHNPVEWMEHMKGLVQYIKPFVDEAKPLLEKLKAEGGAK